MKAPIQALSTSPTYWTCVLHLNLRLTQQSASLLALGYTKRADLIYPSLCLVTSSPQTVILTTKRARVARSSSFDLQDGLTWRAV